MILGKVDAFKQAVISLELQGAKLEGSDRQTETVEAIVDTGYDGYLTVTFEIAARLQFPFRETRTYQLGNGDLVDFAIHDATVLWDGQAKDVATLVTDGGVLVGMSLLTGYTLFIDAIDGGEVRIAERPEPQPLAEDAEVQGE